MDVIMPQLGETVEEGTVAAWHKKEGDKVAIDELLVEIETDKVATEVPSLVAGTLLKILVGEGETVKAGTTLAIIDSGTGPGAAPPKAAGTRGGTEIVAFSPLRKRIAEHMVRSKATSAHVLQAIEVDFSGVEAARGALKKAWREREETSLTYLPFIARAVALALPEFPHLNAHVAGDSLGVYQAINLSLAVDLDRGGLVAPGIKNVAAPRGPETARAIRGIAGRARSNTPKPHHMTDGP